ncbi:MAG: Photosystem I reaction center subunit IX [Chroococcidiopsis cubana SAG 39.79]|jgi:photosystem I subunit IX|uniref:Photosystem I reaction center subunit IX n=1 Tax=Chroococcidiopsis thermalis (strain PCC 7203) TaxID=251229 RepID=K9TX00_CHRTP|nr:MULTISPECIES: photosystem I reaction centre subunit IX / PsaJ [Chroococcidiopsis]MBE9018055.1 Photosystem I reaction center subunit IX [Chroococcidiopsidales cyanobacterium LEGE 13417]PSB41011.1 Photosystem I reaction center subunit IX [Cyanosarcina cf. burmensis CCALA 770]AFY87342.1 photosystem I reaction centre subunit IX / PsaJ [Chroococcidiopsis thermalis PCC 7203]MDV2991570.1 Photosystem I reaction center subunit IX [Chroococcidiopsis sp. SAG 2025]MDZ4874726.1 Photosystem I reaction ce
MQQKYFLQYLSLAPVLLFAWLAETAVWLIVFNYFFPDLLFHPLP